MMLCLEAAMQSTIQLDTTNGRTIELGQHWWGYVMQEQVTLYHTRGLGEGGECDDGIYYFGTLEVVE